MFKLIRDPALSKKLPLPPSMRFSRQKSIKKAAKRAKKADAKSNKPLSYYQELIAQQRGFKSFQQALQAEQRRPSSISAFRARAMHPSFTLEKIRRLHAQIEMEQMLKLTATAPQQLDLERLRRVLKTLETTGNKHENSM